MLKAPSAIRGVVLFLFQQCISFILQDQILVLINVSKKLGNLYRSLVPHATLFSLLVTFRSRIVSVFLTP